MLAADEVPSEEGTTANIVTESCEHTLRAEILARTQPFSESHIIRIVHNVASALHVLHSQNPPLIYSALSVPHLSYPN